MPLIIISGHPSSGKTYRARQIIQYFASRLDGSISNDCILGSAGAGCGADAAASQLSALNLGTATSEVVSMPEPVPENGVPSTRPITHRPLNRNMRIHYISDHTCHLPRSIYATAKQEKDGRATLYSAVKRVLGKNEIVVLDSGNYIKGWRYQLYCEAKNAGTGSCVVHVGVPVERCRGINEGRLKKQESFENTIGGDGDEDPYEPQIFEELAMRFEEPNPMARWDSPLFAVPWEDPEPPSELIYRELVEGVGKDGRIKVVRPNQATMAPPKSSSNHLYELDRTTQLILSQIQEYQKDHPDEGGAELALSLQSMSTASNGRDLALSLTLPTQPVSFPQLQRLRRQFISLHRQQAGTLGIGNFGPDGGGLSKERVGELFVGFLEAQWGVR